MDPADERGKLGPGEPAVVVAVGRELHTPAAAGVVGLVFAVLFVVSLALLYREPPRDSTAAQIAVWYLQTRTKTIGIVGLYLLPFAGIAFLWFIAAIRSRIGGYEDRFFATVFLGSGILFVAMLYAAAAAAGASLAAVRFQGAPPPSPDVFVFARGLAYTFLYVYGVRAAAVFMIVTSTIGLRTKVLPRWLVFLGFAIALVLLFSVSYFKGFVFIFPAWVAVVSVEILIRARSERRELPAPTA
ncbi:hypothetical protein OM076_10750 [Solirubrobacter ginsenosidimutans]|uniref:DUF4386 family protein n=1 Tax=Solirubrobacter ginsenosidimutans TaxID=490573 RepID=A0A9X3MQD4_9ACTN|nr:hypothetical protein [Solirubrobacter ginsenosidimutans]MDA0160744.1 hypothetical protein [Solirubrobacter ginsenosidimutans]